jgi:putative oxidoreductase
MFTRMLQTDGSVTLLLIRVALGFDMFVHGAMKLGVLGNGGIPSTMRYFDGLHVPHFFAWLAIVAEFFGGIGLMAGLLSRIAAFGVGCTMVVAIFLRHLPYGYLMNWHGGLPFGTEGYEYHTLAIAMAAGIMLEGAGAFSVDRWLAGHVPVRRAALDLEHAHQ